jgi:hypothetical protein
MPRAKKAPPAAETPPDGPILDTANLIARFRAGDDAAMRLAYRRVFDSDFGRLVLTDMLASAGVGQQYAGPPDLYALGEHLGAHNFALGVMNLAGFDQASAITMVMTDQLEGPRHDDDDFADAYPELD